MLWKVHNDVTLLHKCVLNFSTNWFMALQYPECLSSTRSLLIRIFCDKKYRLITWIMNVVYLSCDIAILIHFQVHVTWLLSFARSNPSECTLLRSFKLAYAQIAIFLDLNSAVPHISKTKEFKNELVKLFWILEQMKSFSLLVAKWHS